MTSRLSITADVEAIQWSYRDVSEGSDEHDVLSASMYHIFACYGMTHTAAQHARMIRLVLTAMEQSTAA